MGVAAIVVDVGVGAAIFFMLTFNTLLTSICFDDQATAGVDAGVGGAGGVDAGVGAAAGVDASVGVAAGGADVVADVDATGFSDDDLWRTTDDDWSDEDSDDKWMTDDDWSDVNDEGDFTDDEETTLLMHVARCQ